MSLVRVPLDVEDTLSCYRQALERRPHCLQVFQHSRSLLLLLLADTQPCEFTVCLLSGHTHVHSHDDCLKLSLSALLVSLSRLCDAVAALSEQKSQSFCKPG